MAHGGTNGLSGWPAWNRLGLGAQTRLILAVGLLILLGTLLTLWVNQAHEEDSTAQRAAARRVQVASLDLTIAMVNQETGLRGYVYTGESSFLEPYNQGQAGAQQALQQLRTETQGTTYEAAVGDVQRLAGDWSAWAEERRTGVASTGRLIDPAAEQEGKTRFDRFRTADDHLARLAIARVASATQAAAVAAEHMRLALLLGGPPVILCLLAMGALLTFSTLRPVSQLAAAAERLAAGHATTVPGTDRMDEVGSLARTLGRWQAAEEAKRDKDRLIGELSTPALRLKRGLLLIPIIGALDSDRAQQLTQQLLRSVVEYRAQVVVIDVTGVAAMDSAVANHLLRTVESCRLLGATTVMTGISAENAETLTRIEVDLASLTTAGDLEDGIQQADVLLFSGLRRTGAGPGRLAVASPAEPA